MSLEPSPPSESVPPAAPVEPPASTAPAASAPVPAAAVPPEKPRKSQPRKFWDAAKTITLDRVDVHRLDLDRGRGHPGESGRRHQDDAEHGAGTTGLGVRRTWGRSSITDTIKINQQVPVRFDLPLKQDTVVTTQSPVPISTQATFSLGQFGSINGTVSLQLPAGTQPAGAPGAHGAGQQHDSRRVQSADRHPAGRKRAWGRGGQTARRAVAHHRRGPADCPIGL